MPKYDLNCDICKNLMGGENRNPDIICDGKYFFVGIYRKWNPHAYRSCIVPKRHIGKEGQNGLDYLLKHVCSDEMREFSSLKRRTRNAIELAAKERGLHLTEREGLPLIEKLERPSMHPSHDLAPDYKDGIVKIDKFIFPKYSGNVPISPGDSGITEAVPILASFANAPLMPEELRRIMVDDLKKHFFYSF